MDRVPSTEVLWNAQVSNQVTGNEVPAEMGLAHSTNRRLETPKDKLLLQVSKWM